MEAHGWNPHILLPQSTSLLYIDFGHKPKDHTWVLFSPIEGGWGVVTGILVQHLTYTVEKHETEAHPSCHSCSWDKQSFLLCLSARLHPLAPDPRVPVMASRPVRSDSASALVAAIFVWFRTDGCQYYGSCSSYDYHEHRACVLKIPHHEVFHQLCSIYSI